MVDARKAIWPIVVTLRTQPKVSATRSNHATRVQDPLFCSFLLMQHFLGYVSRQQVLSFFCSLIS